MLILTCIPSMVVIFYWMGQTHQTVNSTKLGRSLSFRDINQIKHAFGGIEAERGMETLRKELEQIIGHGDMLWIANMVKSGLAEMQRTGWMSRKLRFMNEDLAGLMDPFLLCNHSIMKLAIKQFVNLEKEMRKAGITMPNSAQHRSRTKLRIYLNKQGSKKVKKEMLHERGSLEKKMWNELREIQIPKLQRFIQNSMDTDYGNLTALLDRYSRLHLIVQVKNAGIRMVDGIRLFWWSKRQPKLAEEDGTDCCYEGMDEAYEEIGTWLEWMGGNEEADRTGNPTIRIDPKMAEELNKIKEEGNDRFDVAIFKELTGRTNFDDHQHIDRMEWQTFILLGHVLTVYYEEEKKINRKITLEKMLEKITPQMFIPDSTGFYDILASPNGLMGLAQDLKKLTIFGDKMMNGLNAEVKGHGNWAELPKKCVAEIREYSNLIVNGVESALGKMRGIMPDVNGLEHFNLDIFRQPSVMGDNDLLEDSFIAKVLWAIEEVKANIPTEKAIEELAMQHPDAVPIINELKCFLVTLDNNADMLKHFLRSTRDVRQIFRPQIDLMEDEYEKEMQGKGKRQKRKDTAKEGTSSSASASASSRQHLLHQQQQKDRIKDIYENALESAETIKILAKLSLQTMELHIGLHHVLRTNEDADSSDQIKNMRRQNAEAHFASLKTILKKEMHIQWEKEDSLLEGLKVHIDQLVKEMTSENSNDDDGLPDIWQVKLLDLIVHLVQHYNRIMGQ